MGATSFRHNLITDTALPYMSTGSPIDPTRTYGPGSINVMTFEQVAERRPGFVPYTADDYGSNSSIVNWHSWASPGGTLYQFINVINSSTATSKVYKLKVGTDTTFQLLYTDSTGTSVFSFVNAYGFVFFGNGVSGIGFMLKYNGTTLSDWGFAGPTSVPTLTNTSAGNVPGFLGHYYVYAYGVSSTGYLSDVSEPSALTSATDRTWTVAGARCTNAACDKVHVYRTEDGGNVLRELSNSPVANPGSGTWSIVDNDTDDDLNTVQAPLPNINLPPTPGVGMVLFAGRIWWFTAGGDTLYFTGYEEILPDAGFAPESAPINNKRRIGQVINGLSIAGPYLIIATTSQMYRISGDSLDTFTLESLHFNYGVRSFGRFSITTDDVYCYWLDSSNSIQVTDGVRRVEISGPIQADLDSLNWTLTYLTIHSVGRKRWLVIADCANGKMFIYDINAKRWMPPWILAGITSSASMVLTDGTFGLFLGYIHKPLKMNLTDYRDDSTAYVATLVTSLIPVVVEENPSIHGVVHYVSVERNATALTDVLVLTDEDPDSGTFTSVFANEKDPPGRTNGTALAEKIYWTKLDKPARRVAVKMSWAAANTNFKLYSFDPAYKVGPGGVL